METKPIPSGPVDRLVRGLRDSGNAEAADALERLARIEAWLHSRRMHPDYEYEVTHGPRKGFDEHEPEGAGWERNIEEGRGGWERFDYYEEAYWRRPNQPPNTRR